ncbi:MAG: hypothetical protein U5K84_13710 [Alkalibacterium sp.]|nr:hypothetical protein [Alkalibacterium sp.]
MKNKVVVPDEKQISRRITKNKLAKGIFFTATLFGMVVLATLLIRIFTQGIGYSGS